MPRPNRGRSIGGEANLAERIKYEREAEGWSPADLARRMTESGCTITTSAIYKIEAGARTIKVDELIALSKVFDLPVDNLLIPMDLLMQQESLAVLKQIEEAEQAVSRAALDLFSAYRRFVLLRASGQDEAIEYLLNHWESRDRVRDQEFEEACELVPGLRPRRERLEPLREALRAHQSQLIQLAQGDWLGL